MQSGTEVQGVVQAGYASGVDIDFQRITALGVSYLLGRAYCDTAYPALFRQDGHMFLGHARLVRPSRPC